MYKIDPSRRDLIDEYRANPGGPHSPELTLVVNRLRMMPIHERHILICTKPGKEWMLARIPAERGVPVELFEDHVFDDYAKAAWEVFCRRWKTVTGHEINE